LAEIEVRGLVENRLGGVDGTELHDPRGRIPGFLRQLAVGGRFQALPRLDGSGRDLPAEGARDVAPLTNEHDGVRVEKRQHADGRRALDDAVQGGSAVWHLGRVLAHADPWVGVHGTRGQRAPRGAGAILWRVRHGDAFMYTPPHVVAQARANAVE